MSRKRSYVSRRVASACGLEFRFRPPSSASHARTSFSQFSKLSGSVSCTHSGQRVVLHVSSNDNALSPSACWQPTISALRRLISTFSSSDPPKLLKSPMALKNARLGKAVMVYCLTGSLVLQRSRQFRTSQAKGCKAREPRRDRQEGDNDERAIGDGEMRKIWWLELGWEGSSKTGASAKLLMRPCCSSVRVETNHNTLADNIHLGWGSRLGKRPCNIKTELSDISRPFPFHTRYGW